MLQMLNREIPVLKHFRSSRYVHPERLYEELLRIAGELATFATQERRAREYGATITTTSRASFAPVLRDIQDFLSARLDRRAIRLELIERAQNAYISTIKDRTLFRNATFVLEVSARRPLTEIQQNLPAFLKVGPNTKMNEIVHAHLPGVTLVHLPTPPPQIRAITDHVYFYFDRTSPLWPEFSLATRDRHAFRRRLAGAPDGAVGDQGRPAMSNNDDPFGRRDRTIIRPNPGGRRPPPPAGGQGPRRRRRRRAAVVRADAACLLSAAAAVRARRRQPYLPPPYVRRPAAHQPPPPSPDAAIGTTG